MARKPKNTEVIMQEAIAPSTTTSYESLFKRIDSLQGVEKGKFTKSLTLDEKKAYIKYCKERDTVLVSGVFRSFEPLGGTLEMTGLAYDGEVPVKYKFYDGMEYTIPKYIAKRFESEFQGIGTWYPTHSHILDQSGNPIVGVGKKNRRFGFSSMDFQ